MSTPDENTPASVDDAGRFALSEDWLATIVGLGIVLLTAAGVITEGWLPL